MKFAKRSPRCGVYKNEPRSYGVHLNVILCLNVLNRRLLLRNTRYSIRFCYLPKTRNFSASNALFASYEIMYSPHVPIINYASRDSTKREKQQKKFIYEMFFFVLTLRSIVVRYVRTKQ